MRKALRLFVLAATLLMSAGDAMAQYPVIQPRIYGSSPFQDSMWAVDTTNWSVVQRYAPSLASFTVTGITGLCYDPTTFQSYCIAKLSAVSGRVLCRINLANGVMTQVGNLGDNFATINFREDGQLFGVTGDGATVPETMYLIDKNTGVKTLAAALGAGADGEIITFNPDDDFFYHWSGNGTVVMEKVMSVAPYSATNIPISGTTGGETFGSMYVKPGYFINSTIASNFRRLNTAGAYSSSMASLPDDLRGIVMAPGFAASSDSICQNDTVFIGTGGLQLFDSLVYHWGDGNDSRVLPGNASHIYTTGGTYTIAIEAATDSHVFDTIATFTVYVEALPSSVFTSSGGTALCPGETTVLTVSPGANMQWYMNGNPVALPSSPTLSTTNAGVYNVIVTSTFGCISDTSATSLTLVSVPNPVVDLGADTAVCGSITLDAQNAGATYVWSSGGSAQTENITSSSSVYVDVTDANGCSASDTVMVTVNAFPVVDLGVDTTVCAGITLDAQNAGSAYSWSTGGSSQTEMITSSGMISVTVVDSNGCSTVDSVQVTVNANPVFSLGADQTSCGDPILLQATISGTYLWSDSSTGSSFLIIGSGTYWLMVTDSNGCSSSDTMTAVFNVPPAVTLSIGVTNICPTDADVVLIGTPSGGSFSGTSVTGNLFDPSVGAGSHDVYYTVVDQNGCFSTDTLTIIVSACIGYEEYTIAENLSIYPNPSQGQFTVEVPAAGSVLVVTDVTGKLVYSSSALPAGRTDVNMDSVAEGVYVVKLVSEKSVAVSRIVIRK